jgi:hypothetical protein
LWRSRRVFAGWGPEVVVSGFVSVAVSFFFCSKYLLLQAVSSFMAVLVDFYYLLINGKMMALNISCVEVGLLLVCGRRRCRPSTTGMLLSDVCLVLICV